MSERAARPRFLRGVALATVLALSPLAVGCAVLPPSDPMPEQGSWTSVDGADISEDLLADDPDICFIAEWVCRACLAGSSI